eukprot:10633834-Ditylum_brightwellii.AAC.1
MASLPNTNCMGVSCIVVWTVALVENLTAMRIPVQGFLLHIIVIGYHLSELSHEFCSSIQHYLSEIWIPGEP